MYLVIHNTEVGSYDTASGYIIKVLSTVILQR